MSDPKKEQATPGPKTPTASRRQSIGSPTTWQSFPSTHSSRVTPTREGSQRTTTTNGTSTTPSASLTKSPRDTDTPTKAHATHLSGKDISSVSDEAKFEETMKRAGSGGDPDGGAERELQPVGGEKTLGSQVAETSHQ